MILGNNRDKKERSEIQTRETLYSLHIEEEGKKDGCFLLCYKAKTGQKKVNMITAPVPAS